MFEEVNVAAAESRGVDISKFRGRSCIYFMSTIKVKFT